MSWHEICYNNRCDSGTHIMRTKLNERERDRHVEIDLCRFDHIFADW